MFAGPRAPFLLPELLCLPLMHLAPDQGQTGAEKTAGWLVGDRIGLGGCNAPPKLETRNKIFGKATSPWFGAKRKSGRGPF